MPNRVLRDWTASETVDQLSESAEILFVRLIMKADDLGCFYGNPKLLKSALFPLRNYSEKQVTTWRDELVKSGIVQMYQVDSKFYLKIKDFNQRLRLMQSKFPQPETGEIVEPSNGGQLTDNGRPETKRNEVEEEEETETKTAVPFLGEVLKTWLEWEKFRKEKKQKITPTSVKKQIQFLGGRGDPEIIAILNRSMTNGWTGLFELPKTNSNGNRNNTQGSTRRSDAIVGEKQYKSTWD